MLTLILELASYETAKWLILSIAGWLPHQSAVRNRPLKQLGKNIFWFLIFRFGSRTKILIGNPLKQASLKFDRRLAKIFA